MTLTHAQRTQIEQQAQELLADIQKYDDTFWGVNLNVLAARYGFDIYETEMADVLQGDITVDGNVRVIRVNINCTHELKRFIIAHEFGHFYTATDKSSLHIRESRKDIHSGKSINEEAMDYFAACILMPEDSFRKAYALLRKKGYSAISRTLAQLFDVPVESAVRRINELHLVDFLHNI